MPNESIIPYLILTLILCAMEISGVVKENHIKRQKAHNALIHYPPYGRDGKYREERR
jgi:hypothetical protein